MGLQLPPRIDLARRPTPFEPLNRAGRRLGLDLWVKRDDLSGLELSGNKVRKLEHLLAAAEAEGADTLITCGGVNSNHARATAIAAAKRGLGSHLILRGEDRHPPAGNLLLDRLVGASLQFITAAEWEVRDHLLAEAKARLLERGRRGYVIPEGGSNALGSMGYAAMVAELYSQAHERGITPSALVHATGSGGTTAGLALGVAAAGQDAEVLGVAVCNDAAYFEAKVRAIIAEAVALGFVSPTLAARARFRILDGQQGRGYGLTTPAEMSAHAALAREEALFVDPVYTGKAFLGLSREAERGAFAPGSSVVFIHTGGIFELFAFGAEIDALGAP